MAKAKYTVSFPVRGWKEHTCRFCGTPYTYELKRTARGNGSTPGEAGSAAQKNAEKIKATAVEMQPCPSCGHYQPDMIAARQSLRHRWVLIAAFVLALVSLLLFGEDVLATATLIWLVSVLCTAVALAHWIFDWEDPNANPARNRELAQTRLAQGILRSGGTVPAPDTRLGPQLRQSPLRRAAAACLLAAIVLAPLPELQRLARHWPCNPDVFPSVAGPGDTVRIYMDESLESVQGYWRGTTKVRLGILGERETQRFPSATTNNNTWGHSISAKQTEKSKSFTPWVEFTLPSDDAFAAARSLSCEITLSVSYPHLTDSDSFTVETQGLSRTVALELAPPQSGQRYLRWWWSGSVLAMALLLAAGGLLLAYVAWLRRQATPTRMLQPEQAGTPAT